MNRRVCNSYLRFAHALTVVAWCSSARAQTAPAADAAALAQRTLGIDLLRQNRAEEAVQAFERSLAIVESPNTRLDLARALLARGRLASALREFDRSRDAARGRVDAGQAQYLRTQRTAATEGDALRPRVPQLILRFSAPPPPATVLHIGNTAIPAESLLGPVPVDPGNLTLRLQGPAVRTQTLTAEAQAGQRTQLEIPVETVGRLLIAVRPVVTGLVVTLDGRILDAHEIGETLEVSPGLHRIRAQAPEHREATAEQTVTLGERSQVSLELPLLPLTTPLRRTPTQPTPTRSRFWAGLGIAGAGVAVAVTGLALWAVADGQYWELDRQCGGPCPSSANAESRIRSGQTLETLGVTMLLGGGALTATGAVLFFVLPREHTQTPRARVFPSDRGLLLQGSF